MLRCWLRLVVTRPRQALEKASQFVRTHPAAGPEAHHRQLPRGDEVVEARAADAEAATDLGGGKKDEGFGLGVVSHVLRTTRTSSFDNLRLTYAYGVEALLRGVAMANR